MATQPHEWIEVDATQYEHALEIMHDIQDELTALASSTALCNLGLLTRRLDIIRNRLATVEDALLETNPPTSKTVGPISYTPTFIP